MKDNNLLDIVIPAIREVTNNPQLEVDADNFLVSDIGLESIDLVDLCSVLEDITDIELDFEEVARFASAQDGATVNMQQLRVRHMNDFLLSKTSS
ncbi:MAG: acyl carrier protein [Pseudomonadota bacterium]